MLNTKEYTYCMYDAKNKILTLNYRALKNKTILKKKKKKNNIKIISTSLYKNERLQSVIFFLLNVETYLCFYFIFFTSAKPT